MKILLRLLALFLIMPVVELALLVYLAGIIDFWPTIAIILVTGLVGGFLAKREGISVWNRLQERLNRGDMPGKELLDGVIILMAGALLVTPGVITDVVGFMGLLPPSRALIRKFMVRKFKQKIEDGSIQASFGMFGPGSWEHHTHGGPPGFEPGSTSEESASTWGGRGRERPDYAGDPHSGRSSGSGSSGNSDDDSPPRPLPGKTSE